MKAGEHGPDELYEKFHVYKAKHELNQLIPLDEMSPSQRDKMVYRESDRLGHDGEFIFVLRPETYDMAAQAALLEYDRCCEHAYPQLSAQITRRVREIQQEVQQVAWDHNIDLESAYRLRAAMRKESH